MMTLKQMREDPRIYSIERISGDDFIDPSTKYEINLKDGYVFGHGGGLEYASSVKELNDLINDIRIDEEF